VPGTAVAKCGSPPAFTYIVRVKIHDSIDQILSTNVSRQVKFLKTSSDSDDDDNAYGGSTDDPWPTTTGVIEPYSVDIKDMGLDSAPQWVMVKFILKQSAHPNVHYYTDNQYIWGITVDNSRLTSSDVCFWDFNKDNNHGDLILSVYIHSPQSANTGGGTPYRFNVALVGIAGAVDTPVVIYPKVLNNG